MVNPIELIVGIFDDELKALDAYRVLKKLKRNHMIDIIDAVVLVKTENGHVLKKEMNDVDTKTGVLIGAISGGLIGLVEGPLGLVVGSVAGAVMGGVAAQVIDMGFPEVLLEEFVKGMKPGSSIVIAILRSAWLDLYLSRCEKLGGKVTHKVLKDELLALFPSNTPIP